MNIDSLINFINQIYNGLDSIKLPLMGFTNLTLWKFLCGMFIISFVYFAISHLLDKKGD